MEWKRHHRGNKRLPPHQRQVDKTSNDGSTALHAACAKGHSSVAVLLLDRGAHVNAQRTNGARKTSPSIMLCLWTLQNGDGQTLRKWTSLPFASSRYHAADARLPKGEHGPVRASHRAHTRVIPCLPTKVSLPCVAVTVLAPCFPFLQARGANVNLGRHGGDTPLYCACDVGSTALVQLLLNKGARVRPPPRAGCCTDRNAARALVSRMTRSHALTVAFPRGQSIPTTATKVDEAYYDGATALMKVCDRGVLEVAMLLVDKGADVNRQTSDGTTPLYSAIQKGFLQLVMLLIKMGAEVTFCRPADGCVAGKREGAQGSSEHSLHGRGGSSRCSTGGECLHASIPHRTSMLHCACEYNTDTEILNALLEKGCDANAARADGMTPLVIAAGRGKADFCDRLIKASADPNLCKSRSGVTPLFAACESRSVDTAMLLLDHNANPNVARFDGETPLIYAAGKGSVPMVALLLSKQAAINVYKPGNGASPLSVACEAGHREVRGAPSAQRQRGHGQSPTQPGCNAFATPLRLPTGSRGCCSHPLLQVAEMLLHQGADVKAARSHRAAWTSVGAFYFLQPWMPHIRPWPRKEVKDGGVASCGVHTL